MDEDLEKDSMLELYIFETQELISQLENIVLCGGESNEIKTEIDEVFRIVHTIKGCSAMMNFNNIAELTHSLEDAFYYIRENYPENVDNSALADAVLKSTDFIKNEISIIQSQSGNSPNHNVSEIVQDINNFLTTLKTNPISQQQKSNNITVDALKVKNENEMPGENCFKALLFFEDGCEMENIRAYNVLVNLNKVVDVISFSPEDILENEETAYKIRKNGFEIRFGTDLCSNDIKTFLLNTIFLKELNLEPFQLVKGNPSSKINEQINQVNNPVNVKQSMVSVNVSKLDRLMDLVGELVISQEMVLQNSDLDGLILNNFHKASRQLQKVTDEIQDAVMCVRMVPLSVTFRKMQRIIHDMSKKLDKEVQLLIKGEETEIDKNINEHLSDPLMHLIRNAMDHGIETTKERIKAGKPTVGKITLEAKNEGGDVWIIVRDDGRGLNRDAILQKAKQQGILKENENIPSDREIYSYIFRPGFSTNKEVTEFSGRGVGMDVVNNNISEIGGTVQVDSTQGIGTAISLKIPLTLAIIDGMKIRVGNSIFVIPINSIKESFRAQESNVISEDSCGSELIMIRGDCCPVLRLHEFYKIQPYTANLHDGIIVVVENDSKKMCLYADELIGTQQVVVKALPKYIKNVKGISGCTVMGDGSVSLIVDVPGLFSSF